MQRPRMKSFILLMSLIVATGAAMAYAGKIKLTAPQPPPPQTLSSAAGILSLSGHLIQTHVLKGSAGRVGLELVLSAGTGGEGLPADNPGIDLVVVLDRSGSMQGPKLEYARQSLLNLMAGLTERDRFQKEFLAVKSAAATGIAVSLDLPRGVRVVDASGYPVTLMGETAVFYPGSLRSGQTRRIFLTLHVPTDDERQFHIGRVTARYRHNGEPREAVIENPFTLACVGDEGRVLSSIDRAGWERKVLSDDYNRLKQEVAASISAGSADSARGRIDAYEKEQKTLNAVVNSPAVTRNLENDLKDLKKQVDETFQGAPAEVAEKRKAGSKALQYEGYSNRRTP